MDVLLSRLRGSARLLILFVLAEGAAYAAPVSPIPLLGGASRTEAPSTLLSVDLDKGDAELFIGGSWKGELTAASGLALTTLGASVSQTESPLLFTQTIDLTVSAKMYDRWFVEGTFLDDYSLNTYRAGYVGTEGETIRYIGVGNVGLNFPAFPYADISGGTPSSFGAYAAFGSGPLTLHALVRYDAATREEKTYVGSNERTISDISPAKRMRGRAFALPDRDLDAIPVVYLEDSSGTLSGSDGRKYRLAAATEAAASAALGIAELASAPAGRVAVAYSKNGSSTPWTSSLGSYGKKGTGSGFLGNVQDAFETGGLDIYLSSYPQCGGGSGVPAAITIGGTTAALVVYENGAFSPFEYSNRYAPSSSAASGASASLVYAGKGTAVNGFELEESTSSSFMITSNAEGETVVTTSGRFFILTSAAAADQRAVETRFPLVSVDPEVYLPGAKGRATDIVVRLTSYGASGGYNIGKDVVAGSIIVTRGGIRDPLAVYDADSGVVNLSSPAGTGELIRISYLKNSQDRRFGSLAAGLGAVYKRDDSFSARAALSLRWNVSGNAFTAPDEPSAGTIALSGSTAWKGEELSAEVAGALTYEASDTTGLYRAAGMEGTEFSLGMSSSAASTAYPPKSPASPSADSVNLFTGFFTLSGIPGTDNQGSLAYRDYASTDVLGNTTLKPITWTGASINTSKTGPYPVSVSELDGKTAYVAEFDLGEGKTGTASFALWAGFQMKLGDEAEALAQARTIIVPYRYYDLAGNAPVRTYIQIGSLADSNGNAESKELVWSAPLGASVSGVSGTSWAYASVDLTDADRERLASSRALRVVVRLDTPASLPTSTVAASGRVLVLPPVAQGAVFRPIVVSGGTVSTAGDTVAAGEKIDASLASAFSSDISRLHPGGESQRVLNAEWTGLNADTAAGVDGYPNPFPLWSYKSLTFFLRAPAAASTADAAAMKTATVRVVIAASSEALGSSGESSRFISVSIPAGAFTAGSWTRVAVDYAKTDTGVFVNGTAVDGAKVSYRPSLMRAWRTTANRNGEAKGPKYFAIVLEPSAGTALPAGNFAVDELCLSDSVASFGSYAGGAAAWKRKGTVLGVGKTAIVSDLSAEARTELNAVGNPFETAAAAIGNESAAKGNGKVSATILGAKVSAEMGLAGTSDSFRWLGGHGLEIPLGPLKIVDRFADDPDSQTVSHSASAALSGPLSAEASGALEIQPTKVTRNWKASASASSEKASAAAAFAALYIGDADFSLLSLPYHSAWYQSWMLLSPDAGTSERRRDFTAKANFALKGERIGLRGDASASSKFNASLDTRAESAECKLGFPFSPAREFEGTISIVRSYSRTERAADAAGNKGNAAADAAVFGKMISASVPLWTAIPFATLGDSALAASFDGASSSSLSASYSDGMETNVKLPRSLGWLALIQPSLVNLTLARAFDRTLDTTVDSIKTTASVQTSAVNVFGAFGSVPAFSFYKSDEFTHALSFSARFPKNEDPDWEIGLRQSLSFFGFTDAKLTLSNIVRAGSEGWSEGTALSWTYPEEKSLMKTLYAMVIGKAAGWKNGPLLAELAEAEAKAERRETAEFTISAATDIAWSCRLKHESIIRAAKKLTWITFATLGASGGRTDGAALALTLSGSIGVSLNLKF